MWFILSIVQSLKKGKESCNTSESTHLWIGQPRFKKDGSLAHTGVPLSAFTEHLPLYLFSLPEINLRRIFTVMKKGWKAKTVFSVCLAASVGGGQGSPQAGSAGPHVLPRDHTPRLGIKLPSSELCLSASLLYLPLRHVSSSKSENTARGHFGGGLEMTQKYFHLNSW